MEQRYRPKRDYRSRTRFVVAATRRSPRFRSASQVRLPPIRRGLLVTILLIVLALLLLVWFMGSDFRIQSVQVENNQGVPVAQIVGASGLIGEHTILVDLNAAARRVDDLPGVDAAQVTCTWEAQCVIVVQVSQALAIWQGTGAGSTKVWVDRQGLVQRALEDILAKLTIRVEEGAIPVVGEPLDTKLLRGLNELVVLQPKVTRYEYSRQYGLMYTDEHGWQIRLGVAERDGAMSRKLEVVRQLSAQLIANEVSATVLDVRFAEAPYYVK